MPARFDYPPQVGVWFPIPMLNPGMQRRPAHFLRPIGLLKPGVDLMQAQGDMDAIARELGEQYPSSNKGWNLRLEPMQDEIVGPLRAPLLLLFGAVALVLMIACVNVANLLLARNSARQKEIAVRTALGASRGRIVMQLVTESVMLAILGGGTGIVLARWGMTLLHSFGPANVPRLAAVQLNKDVLAFTAVLSISAGILFGLVPAFQASKTDVQDFLNEVGRFSTHAGHQRLRNVLVICEVMLSVALLVGAGLLLDSLWRLLHENPGFNSERVLTAQLVLPSKRYSEEDRRAAFFRDFLEKIRVLPGVEAAGSTSGLPLSGQLNDDYFTTDATPPARLEDADLADMRLVIGDYFLAMRIPLLEGRLFSEPDEPNSQRDVVVDEPFVRRYFPSVDPVGRHLLIFEPGGFVSREIVGVVGGARFFALQGPPQPTMYLPYAQLSGFNMNIVVRSAADPEQLASSIRVALASVDPDESLSSFRAMQEVVSASAGDKRFDAFLLALFSAVALMLAAAGIYGLISYMVAQKTREIGIRLALGAEPSDVLKSTLAQGMKLVAIGMICGLALSVGLTRLMASQLYGVKATDPSTFAAVVIILGLVSLLACYIPARRATKVDPMVALRHE